MSRTLWTQPGGKIAHDGVRLSFGAILIETGVAVLHPFTFSSESIGRWEIRIPIFTRPVGAIAFRSIPACWIASHSWHASPTNALWAVDQTSWEETPGRVWQLLPSVAIQGTNSSFYRVGYHVTVFLRGEMSDEDLTALSHPEFGSP
ncbi:hypothetical protein [Streptomyces sp. NPDC053048]|uniref:hypothetical protein n=1 Tax=Streptomyces sp. NPDC053048 TaxID=3365694 RepID=UPI0037D38D36